MSTSENDDVGAGEGEAASVVGLKPRVVPPKVEQLPQFRVLLHNDDVNTFEWVIDAIVELTPHTKDKARVLALEADATGLALVVVTHQERAELYQDQFKSKKLVVTIEPVH